MVSSRGFHEVADAGAGLAGVLRVRFRRRVACAPGVADHARPGPVQCPHGAGSRRLATGVRVHRHSPRRRGRPARGAPRGGPGAGGDHPVAGAARRGNLVLDAPGRGGAVRRRRAGGVDRRPQDRGRVVPAAGARTRRGPLHHRPYHRRHCRAGHRRRRPVAPARVVAPGDARVRGSRRRRAAAVDPLLPRSARARRCGNASGAGGAGAREVAGAAARAQHAPVAGAGVGHLRSEPRTERVAADLPGGSRLLPGRRREMDRRRHAVRVADRPHRTGTCRAPAPGAWPWRCCCWHRHSAWPA